MGCPWHGSAMLRFAIAVTLLGSIRPSEAQIRSPQLYVVNWNSGHLTSITTYIAPGDIVNWVWDNPTSTTEGTNVLAVDDTQDPLLPNQDPWALFGSSGEANFRVANFSVVFSFDFLTATLPSGRRQHDTYGGAAIIGGQPTYVESNQIPDQNPIFNGPLFVTMCSVIQNNATGERCRLAYYSGRNLCRGSRDVNPADPLCSSLSDIVRASLVVVEEPCPNGSFSATCADPSQPRGLCQSWQTVRPGFYEVAPGTACQDRQIAACTLCNCPTQFESVACQGGSDPTQNRVCQLSTVCQFPGPTPRIIVDLNPGSASQAGCSATDRQCGCCDPSCPAAGTNPSFPNGGWWDVGAGTCNAVSSCSSGFIQTPATPTSDNVCRVCNGGECIKLFENRPMDVVVIIDDSGSVTTTFSNEPAFQSEAIQYLFERMNMSGNLARTMALTTSLPIRTLFDLNSGLTLEDRIALLPRETPPERPGFLGQALTTVYQRFLLEKMQRNTVIVVLYDGLFGESLSQDAIQQQTAVNALLQMSQLRATQQDLTQGNGPTGWNKSFVFGDNPFAEWEFQEYVPRAVDHGFQYLIIERNGNQPPETNYLLPLSSNSSHATFEAYQFDLNPSDASQRNFGTAVWDGSNLRRTSAIYPNATFTPYPGTIPLITGSEDRLRVAMVSYGTPTTQATINALSAADITDSVNCPTCFDRAITRHFNIDPSERNLLLELDEIVAQLFTDDGAPQYGMCEDSACSHTDFEVQACNLVSNQVCQKETYCDPVFQYEAVPPTATTDRVCNFSLPCPERTFELVPLTYSADRVCVRLPDCVDELEPCVTAGGGCGDSPVDTYQAAQPTATSDRQCTIFSQCDGRYVEQRRSRAQYTSILPTATSDRECSNCTSIPAVDPVDFIFVIDASGSIQNPLYGGGPGSFDLIKAFAQNMVSRRPLPNRYWTDSQELRGAAGTKFAAVEFSDEAFVRFSFQDTGYDINRTLQAIQDNISYVGGETFLDSAISLVIDELLDPDPNAMLMTGFRNFSVPVVIVVITDGNPTNETAAIEQISRFTSEQRLLDAFEQGKLILYPVALGPAGSNVVPRVRSLFDLRSLVAPENRDRVVVPTIYDLVNVSIALSTLNDTRTQNSIIQQMNADLTTFSPRCNSSEYVSSPCNATSDIVCSPLTTCFLESQYISRHPTITSDRECSLISLCPSPATYEAMPPRTCYEYLTEGRMSPSAVDYCTDRICAPVTICDPCTEYQIASPTATTDRQCASIQTCPYGFYSSIEATINSDRVCEQCDVPCRAGTFEAVPCQPSGCASGQQPGGSTNRRCDPVTECYLLESIGDEIYYTSTPATATTDAICMEVSSCDGVDQYEEVAPTPTTDRVCGTSNVCTINQWISSEQTSTTARVCTPRQQCQVGEYEYSPGNTTTNRDCRDVSQCNLRQYEVSGATPTTDRQCANITGDGVTCPNGQWRVAPATRTADIVCRQPTVCRFRQQYVVSEFTRTTDRVCADIATCTSSQYEVASPSASTNRICDDCSVCAGVADQQTTSGLAVDGVSHSAGTNVFSSGEIILLVDLRSDLDAQLEFANNLVDATGDVSASGTHFALVSFGTRAPVLEIGFQQSMQDFSNEIDAFRSRIQAANGTFTNPVTSAYQFVMNILSNQNGPILAGVRGTGARYRGRSGSPFATSAIFMITQPIDFGEQAPLAIAIQDMENLALANGWPIGTEEVVRRHVVTWDPSISALFPVAIANDAGQRFELANVQELTDETNIQEVLFAFCREGCPAEMYQSDACGINADRVCSAATRCSANQFEQAALTATTNRQCASLAICNSGQFESMTPTATTDRVCGATTVCNGPGRCSNGAPCEYQIATGTSTSDTVCAPLRQCSSLEFEAILPTQTTNRVCNTIGPCTVNQYLDPKPAVGVDPGNGCRNLTVCTADQFERFSPLPTTDRICQDLTSCRPYEYEEIAATISSDRSCSKCTSCFGDLVHQYFVLSRANSIDHGSGGSSGYYEVLRDIVEYLIYQAPSEASLVSRATLFVYPAITSNSSAHNHNNYTVFNLDTTNARDTLLNIDIAADASAWIEPSPAAIELVNRLTTQLAEEAESEGEGETHQARIYFLTDGEFSTTGAGGPQTLTRIKSTFPQVPVEVVTIGNAIDRRPDLRIFWESVSSFGSIREIQSPRAAEATVNDFMDSMCTPCATGDYELHPCSPNAPSVDTSSECRPLIDEMTVDSCVVFASVGICNDTDIFELCNYTCSRALNIPPPNCAEATFSPTMAPTPAPTTCATPPVDTASTGSCRTLASGGFCDLQQVFEVCASTCSAWLNISLASCQEVVSWFPKLQYNKVCVPLTACDPLPDEFASVVATISSDRTCTASQQCSSSQFELVPPQVDRDRVCQNIRVCDVSTEWIQREPTATTDRICAPLRECADDQYISTRGTLYADHVCSALAPPCNSSSYECIAPLRFINRRCCLLTRCGIDEYISRNATYSTDRICVPTTECDATQFIEKFPTTSTDRICANLTECVLPDFVFQNATASSDRVCSSSTECTQDQYEARPVTTFLDRECRSITNCSPLEYEANPPSRTSDRVCHLGTICTNTQFEASAMTLTSNRICTNLSVCIDSQFEVQAPTIYSDRNCSACTSCRSDQFAAVPCQSNQDTVCRDLRVCLAHQYQRPPGPTASTDRICDDATVCREGQLVVSALTATSDRQCRYPSVSYCNCSVEYEISPATALQGAQCRPLTQCGEGEFESLPPTCTSDRLCSQCGELNGVCSGFPSDIVFVLDQSDSIEDPAFGGILGQFRNVTNAAANLATLLEVSRDGAHLATLLFGGGVEVAFTFAPRMDVHPADWNVSDELRSISYVRRGVTAFDRAIRYTRAQVLDPNSNFGFRDAPIPGSTVAVVYFTDFWDSLTNSATGSLILTELAAMPTTVSQYTWWNGIFHRVVRTSGGGINRVQVSPLEMREELCPSRCGPGSYLSSTCSSTADSLCSGFTMCNPANQFETGAPTISTDRKCTTATQCNRLTQFESIQLSVFADRQCSALATCARGPAGEILQYEAVANTATSDRICANTTSCIISQYISALPTATSDRSCEFYSAPPCNNNIEFLMADRTETSDRVCAPLTTCTHQEVELLAPTATTDRACETFSSEWDEFSGFCASTGTVWPKSPGLYFLNLTAQECEQKCMETVGCRSYVRRRGGLSQCVLNVGVNSCCRSIVQSNEWESVISTNCNSSFINYEAPLIVSTPSMFRNPDDGPALRQIELAKTQTWDRVDEAFCLQQLPNTWTVYYNRSLTNPNDRAFIESQCQISCDTLMECAAYSVGTTLSVVTLTEVAVCVLSNSSCSDVSGQASSQQSSFTWTTFIKPTSPCQGVTCDPPPVCFGPSSCNGGVCIASSGGADGTICNDDLDITPSSICRAGVCEGPCPFGTMFIARTPVPSVNLVPSLGNIPTETVHCATVTPVCATDEYDAGGPTPTSDRQCTPLSMCTGGEWECATPTATTDRSCCPIDCCNCDGRVEIQPATAYQNSICEEVRECGLDEYEVEAPTNTSNRVCSELDTCILTDQYEQSHPTATTNRICANVSCCCETSQYVTSPQNLTSDRICEPMLECMPGTWAPTEPSRISETLRLSSEAESPFAEQKSCTRCTQVCTSNTELDLVFVVDESASIDLPYAGGRRGNYQLELAFFSRIVQGLPNVAADGARVATVSYSRNADVDFDFNSYTNAAAIANHINRLSYAGLDSRLGEALRTVRENLLAVQSSGYRRLQVPLVVIIVIDGQLNGESQTDLSSQVEAWSQLREAAPEGTFSVWVYVARSSQSPTISATDRAILDTITGNASRVIEFSDFDSELSLLADEFVAQDFVRQRCLAGCDYSIQFESSSCTPSTNRICTNLTQCSVNQFESRSPTRTDDRVCSPVRICLDATRLPDPLEYETRAPTFTSNRECGQVLECDIEASYISRQPTATTNRECSMRTACGQGEFEAIAPTSSSQRECRNITSCDNSTEYRSFDATPTSDAVCVEISECGDNTYECAPPEEEQDRQCCTCRECSTNEYGRGCSNGESDRVCLQATTCNVGSEFEVQPPTMSSNRVCRAYTQCVRGNPQSPLIYSEIEIAPPTPTSDRRCEGVVQCCSGFYESAPATLTSQPQCDPVSACTDKQYQVAAATYTTDTDCMEATVCDFLSQFESTYLDLTTDRQCTAFTQCSSNEYVSTGATSTSDRDCSRVPCDLTLQYCSGLGLCGSGTCNCIALDPRCASGTWESQSPSLHENRICSPLTVCQEEVQIESVPPTYSTDRQCCEVNRTLTPTGMDRFSAPIPQTEVPESLDTLEAPDASSCARNCLANPRCDAFSYSSTFSSCLLYENPIVMLSNSMFLDFLYYEKIDLPTPQCIANPPVTPSTEVTPMSYNVNISVFHPMIHGSVALANVGYLSKYTIRYDCATFSECHDNCSTDVDCVGFDFSMANRICVYIHGYLQNSPQVRDDFVHFTKRTIVRSSTKNALELATYFGRALYPVTQSARQLLVLDGSAGSFGQVHARETPYSYLSIQIRFQIVNADTFSYLLAKSNPSGTVRQFALGVTSRFASESQIWIYYTSTGSTGHSLLRFEIPDSSLVDGQFHDVHVVFYGRFCDFTFDGVAADSVQLDSPFEDSEGELYIGQRAPGVFPFTGTIESINVGGPQITSAVFPPSENILGKIVRDCEYVPQFLELQGGSTGLLKSNVVSVGASFSVALTVRMNVQGSGYLFAKTNRAGSRRRYAIYVPRVGRVRFYYSTPGSSTHNLAYFTATLNDGFEHRVVLSVHDNMARFQVDDTYSITTLSGSIQDCEISTNCILGIGQRSSSNGGRYAMSGTISEFVIHPSQTYSRYPATGIFDSVNLLDSSLEHVDVGSVVVGSNGLLRFDGSSRRQLAIHPMTYAGLRLDLVFMHETARSGYLVSHSNSTGTQRYLSLYSSTRGRYIWFFYTTNSRKFSVRFYHNLDLLDSNLHQLTLSVYYQQATLKLDNYIETVNLRGNMEPCTSDCEFALGQRAPGAYGMVGSIQSANIQHIVGS